jgi:predicted MFS family arabinose efflux permease
MAERRPEKSLAASFKQLFLVGRNRTLLLASFFCALFLFANFSTSYGFTPIFAQQIGASKKDLGVLFFWYMLPNTLATLLSGTYIRRLFSARAIIFAGFLLLSGTVFFIPLVDRLGILYGLQAFNGIGVGLIFPLLMGLAVQSAAPEQQATAMGFFQSLYALGMTLGPVISGIVAQRWGLSSVFILNGLLCLFGAFFAFIKIPSASRKES